MSVNWLGVAKVANTTFTDLIGTTWRVISLEADGVYAGEIDYPYYRVWTAEELAVMDVNINNLTESA